MKKTLLYILLPTFILSSCVSSLDDYNLDTKNPTDVSSSSLFISATKSVTDILTTPNVNTNVFRFYVQQWAATTYQDEPQYNFETRNIPLNIWNPLYREALMDFKESRRVAEATPENELSTAVKANQVACTEIMSVLTWSVLVNIWGSVPYSEALGDINQPKYDDGKTIYLDLIKRLSDAINQIDVTEEGFRSSDNIYSGDMSKWVKFAHSLKLKLAITLADVDESTARTVYNESQAGSFSSNEDNATFKYLTASPNHNPIAGALVPPFTARQDYVIGKTIVDKLNSTSDPRSDFYFKDKIDGQYRGAVQGQTAPYGSFSHVSDVITNPAFESILLDYAEVLFIKSEAAARGWGGDALSQFKNAVTASLDYWGVSTTNQSTFLSSPGLNVAITSANFRQIIGEQKWVALYNRGYEAWNEWRRLDYPLLQPATDAQNPMPTRYPFTTGEYNLNAANVAAAAATIEGGDEVDGKVFWDVR